MDVLELTWLKDLPDQNDKNDLQPFGSQTRTG
jgi:hypothetical protein